MNDYNISTEERSVVFNNNRGQKLIGVLHLPVRNYPPPVVIMAHGFTDDKTGDNRLFVKFARKAAEAGFAVLRFDFAGSGDSEGDFSQMTVDTEIEDLRSAVDFIHALPQIDKARISLVGYSLGGAVSVVLAAKDKRLGGFIGWAPASFLPATFRRILGKKVFSLSKRKNTVQCSNGNKQFLLGRGFFYSIEKYDLRREIGKISPRPVLLIQGSLDKKVLPKDTEIFFKRAGKPKRVVRLKGSGHSFAYYENKLIDETLRTLRKWELNGH